MSKSTLLISTAIGLTMAVAGPAVALQKLPHDGRSKDPFRLQHMPGAPAKPQRNSKPVGDQLKEIYVVSKFDHDQTQLVGGFANISTASLPCKKACTIITDSVMQLLSYYSYNQVALCPVIDGYFTNGSCVFVGAQTHTPHDAFASYHPVPLLTNISLSAGTHQADFYVYTVAPAYLGPFQIDYHVYK